MSLYVDFDPRYPFLVERRDPIGSTDMANYVAELSDNQTLRQLRNVATEEAITKYWIKEMQQGSKLITEISNKLTRYVTRMANLKDILERRVGHRLPELKEAPETELMSK